jgi:hypothetical protein
MKVLEADFLASTKKGDRAKLATAMGGLGRSWAGLEERIRILKGVPLPGSLTHDKIKRTKLPRQLGSVLASVRTDGPVDQDAQPAA